MAAAVLAAATAMEAYAIPQEVAVSRLGVLQERPESIDRQASTTRTRRRLLLECFEEATAMATAR